MTKMNEEQVKLTKFNIDTIKQELEMEIDRLVKSGCVSSDSDGYYPLSLIYKVALENLSKEYGVTDKPAYKNLQKF